MRDARVAVVGATGAVGTVTMRILRERGFENFVGRSPKMLDVFETIRKTADSGSTVMITGESGTGKELVARGIHHASARAEGPFVAVNCGAVPTSLIEA